MAPGKTPEENHQFVIFLIYVVKAVYTHNALLKASISSATNSHRLGASEAPPAIISIFLGSLLNQVLDKLESSSTDDAIQMDAKVGLKLNIGTIPELLLDNTDRNRTSPFAFTGNRFEFRAVGSSANCASAMIALNAAVADQLKQFKLAVDTKIQAGEKKEKAIISILKEYIKDSKAIRFDGNGYRDDWKEEAFACGLDCETSVPKIFDAYLSKQSIDMLRNTGVMTQVELEASNVVKWEIYTKKVQIEARVLGDLAMKHIILVATRYQSLLLDNICKIKQIFSADNINTIANHDIELIEKISFHSQQTKMKVNQMVDARKIANKIEEERAKAIIYHDYAATLLDQIRYYIDKLELIIDNQMWPLPKYRDFCLFDNK